MDTPGQLGLSLSIHSESARCLRQGQPDNLFEKSYNIGVA